MIHAYPGRPSVRVGEELTLHVSTSAPRFRVAFVRCGERRETVAVSGWLPGEAMPFGPAGEDWGWPAYPFPISAGWPPGPYAAILEEGDEAGHPLPVAGSGDLGRGEGKALFVLRAAAPTAPLLYKIPLFTYQAYNQMGVPAGSLYTGRRVTLRRAGGGLDSRPWDGEHVDVYDPSSPRQTFPHWDLPFIAWLERNGFAADYCTDLDLHEDGRLLEPYRLLVSAGHDEYWSRAMRDQAEAFVRRGGNLAFFGANTCWWRVQVLEKGTALLCLKHRHPGLDGGFDQWWNGQARRPENSLTGVSYRYGGGWWAGARTPLGYRVQHADHWVYAGTGLRDGDVFGAEEALVGYECDGVALAEAAPEGRAVPAFTDGTPRSFVILGIARLGAGWRERPEGERAVATLGVYTEGGTVFNAATVDWARLLAAGHGAVERITRNVLERLLGEAQGAAPGSGRS
jgi:hypothetical protein